MSGLSIFGIKLIRSQHEQEIMDLFERYSEKLSEQKSQSISEIERWQDNCVLLIHQHAARQKHLVENQYEKESARVKEQRQNFIENLNAYEKSKAVQEINELIKLCKTLKFELSELARNPRSIDFINAQQSESVHTENNTANSHDRTNQGSRQNRSLNQNDQMKSTYDTPSYPRLAETSEGFRETNNYPSTMNRNNEYRYPVYADNNQNTYNKRNDDLLEKCPICFMMFPPTMTAETRSEHVQEHNIDD